MGRGTYHGVRNPTTDCGTLPWAAEPDHGAGALLLGVESYDEMRNPITGRGTLPWDAELYHGVRNPIMGRGTLSWGAEPTMGAEPYHREGTLPLGAEQFG